MFLAGIHFNFHLELLLLVVMALKLFSEKTIVAMVVSLALFMDALDTTIINTAIPAMARSLSVNPVDLKIALISYLVSLAIFIPTSGWVADKFGVKQAFIFALGIFTLSSVACGFSENITQLVIARSCQGLGGALMLPLGRLIILRTFSRHEVVGAMNHVIMIVSIGLMLGPFAGGVITDHFSWHWIFWVNIPVGLLAMIVASRVVKDMTPKRPRPFDVLGFLMFGGSLAVLTFSLSDLSQTNANQEKILFVMCVAIVILICYFFRARHQKHPLINTKLFDIRTFKISIVGNLICRLSFGGIPFLLPLLLQIGLGYSAQLSGTLLVPIALGIFSVKYFSINLLRMIGYKKLLVINTLFIGLAVWMFRLIGPTTPLSVIALMTYVYGMLITLQFSGCNSLAYADLPDDELSSATGLISTVQQLAQSFGVAVSALLLGYFSLHTDEHFALVPTTFHNVFFALGIFTFLSAVIFIRLKPNDGHQMLKAPANSASVP